MRGAVVSVRCKCTTPEDAKINDKQKTSTVHCFMFGFRKQREQLS